MGDWLQQEQEGEGIGFVRAGGRDIRKVAGGLLVFYLLLGQEPGEGHNVSVDLFRLRLAAPVCGHHGGGCVCVWMCVCVDEYLRVVESCRRGQLVVFGGIRQEVSKPGRQTDRQTDGMMSGGEGEKRGVLSINTDREEREGNGREQ